MIRFDVVGIPAPQGSKVRTRWGMREDNPNTRPWRATVAAEAALVAPAELLTGPLACTARFFFPRPKAHYRTGAHAGELKPGAPRFHASKPDGDKLARAVGDALSGVLIRDDACIAWWEIVKLYGQPARAEITVEPLDLKVVIGEAA